MNARISVARNPIIRVIMYLSKFLSLLLNMLIGDAIGIKDNNGIKYLVHNPKSVPPTLVHINNWTKQVPIYINKIIAIDPNFVFNLNLTFFGYAKSTNAKNIINIIVINV